MAEVITNWSLINDEYFKTYSPIPDNYNLKELRPYFHVAEKLWVEPILGTALYEELLEQVNTNTVSETNSTLLLQIYPYLSFAIVYEALPFVAYHMSEVGITKGQSDNSTAVSINDVNYINSHIRNQVEILKKILKEFLEKHAEHFPLYTPDDCECNIECECENYEWLWHYYNNGVYDRYEYLQWWNRVMNNKRKPNPYCQLYSTRRWQINLK